MPHDFLSTFPIKAIEYGIALSFLALFVPFWRFLNGGRAARLAEAERARPVPQPAADFALPDGYLFHPGHTWARPAEGAVSRVGLDELAHKLVGAIGALELPAVGARLTQGGTAFALVVDGKRLELLSPLDGKVVAVNAQAVAEPATVKRDPYGEGWLLELEAERSQLNARQLLSGATARRWIEGSWTELKSRGTSRALAQDGGAPVDGIARALDPQNWEEIARGSFLTGEQR